jgi:hypothetical protein
MPAAAAAADVAASMTAASTEEQGETSRELVIVHRPQVDEITLAKWLKVSSDDDESFETWMATEAEGPELPWEECPEAIMDYSPDLGNSILQKICSELKELAKWMMEWDKMIAEKQTERIRDRGRGGQCRQSNHVGVCHSWDPTVPKSRPRFKEAGRRAAAQFYGAIMDWAESKGKGLGFWRSGESTRFTIILRAIRAIWKKEKCQMEMLFDSEKNLETTYYIPISLLTYMKERFPILMWAEMFKTSPKFSYIYGPQKVLLAIDLYLQGDPSPWKHAQNSIEDEKQRLAITDGSYQTKRSKRESTPDPRTNLQPGAAAWLEVPLQQRWSASGGTWEGWISYPSTGTSSEWWERQDADASSRDAMSSVSEEQGHRAWSTTGYEQSRPSTTSSWRPPDLENAPWRKR